LKIRISRRRTRIIAAAAAAVLIAAAVLFAALRLRKEALTTVTFRMDTYISFYIKSRDPRSLVDLLDAEAGRCEELFDRFDPGSEIGKVNAAGGDLCEVSEETYRLVETALRLAAQSSGAFDPTVGALSDLWGFGAEPHVPDEGDITAALETVGYSEVALETEGGRYYIGLAEGQKLDLGAIAKGYVLSRMQRMLCESDCDCAVISLGGNVLLYGSAVTADGTYSVGIRRPEEGDAGTAFTIELGDCVVSTSGGYERYFYEDGVRYIHIIDPFTGRCAEGELLSFTVIGSDPTEADALSTAYFVKGLDACLDALASGEVTGAAVDSDKVIYISADLEGCVRQGSVSEGYRIEVIG